MVGAPVFRQAQLSDLDALVRNNIAMAVDSEGVTLAPDNARGGVAAVLNDPICSKGKYFVLELDGDAVAQLFITYEWSDWCAAVGLLSRMSPSSQLWWPDASNRRNAQVWWVQSVYVAPEHRRKGYYRSLYDHVCKLARSEGVCGIRLYADEHNTRARLTYEALGMTSHYRVYEDMFHNQGLEGYPQ